MPKKQSEYIVRFQLKERVDEAICRHSKFAKKKLEQLGRLYPHKTITVVVSGTRLEEPKRFQYKGENWEQYVEMV